MRQNGLLSPHRTPKGEPKRHHGTMVTEAPDVVWATDGAVVQTLDEGRVGSLGFMTPLEAWSAALVPLAA
jgi:hypothetical protein